jgi:hypothetical protein
MKRKIYSESILRVFEGYFKNNHAKFIHPYPTKLEDFGKTFVHEDKTYELVGMDNENNAVIHEPATGFHFICPLQFVKNKLKKAEMEVEALNKELNGNPEAEETVES